MSELREMTEVEIDGSKKKGRIESKQTNEQEASITINLCEFKELFTRRAIDIFDIYMEIIFHELNIDHTTSWLLKIEEP